MIYDFQPILNHRGDHKVITKDHKEGTQRNTNIKSLYTSLCVLCEILGALCG
jgi:hypothetical protein